MMAGDSRLVRAPINCRQRPADVARVMLRMRWGRDCTALGALRRVWWCGEQLATVLEYRGAWVPSQRRPQNVPRPRSVVAVASLLAANIVGWPEWAVT